MFALITPDEIQARLPEDMGPHLGLAEIETHDYRIRIFGRIPLPKNLLPWPMFVDTKPERAREGVRPFLEQAVSAFKGVAIQDATTGDEVDDDLYVVAAEKLKAVLEKLNDEAWATQVKLARVTFIPRAGK
jgi:hypothetical protein